MFLQIKNLKGNITDVIFLVVVVLVFAISFVLLVTLQNAFSSTQYYNRIDSGVRDLVLNVMYGSDYIVPFLFFFLTIVSMIAASKLNTRPVLYLFVFVFAPIVILFSWLFMGLTKTIITSAELEAQGLGANYFYQHFPYTMFIVDNIVSLTIFIFVGILVISYIGGRFGI